MKPILTINKPESTTAKYIYDVFNNKQIQALEWFTVEYDYAHNTIKVWDCYGADDLCLEFREDVDAMTVLNKRYQIKPMIEYFQKGYNEYNG